MSNESIQKAVDGINNIINKICLFFCFCLILVIVYSIYQTNNYQKIIMNQINQAYDYEYSPEETIENILITGDNNLSERIDD